jgi:hypothetical protein
MPSHMMSRRQRVPVFPMRKWFPGRGSAFVAPSVRIFYSTRIVCEPIVVEERKVSSSGPLLPQKRGVSVISPTTPPPACISIARTEQGCRIRHTGPVQRGQLGHLYPVPVSRFQLSLQRARSYSSERKVVNGTQLPSSEFILQKADVSIRASQAFT